MKGTLGILIDAGSYKIRVGVFRCSDEGIYLIRYKESNPFIEGARKIIVGGKIQNPGRFESICDDLLSADGVLDGFTDKEMAAIKSVVVILPGRAFSQGETRASFELGGPTCKIRPYHITKTVRAAIKKISYDKFSEMICHQYIHRYLVGRSKEEYEEAPINKTANIIEARILYTLLSQSYYMDYHSVIENILGNCNVYFVSQPFILGKLLGEYVRSNKPSLAFHLGHTTTEVLSMNPGELEDYWSYRWAGDTINQDIVNYVESLSYSQADEMKIEEGSAYIKGTTGLDDIIFQERNTLNKEVKITRKLLTEIIQARLEDIFIYLAQALREYSTIKSVPFSSIYLSGGSAQLPRLNSLISDIFSFPVHTLNVEQVMEKMHLSEEVKEDMQHNAIEKLTLLAGLHFLNDKKEHSLYPRKYSLVGYLKNLI